VHVIGFYLYFSTYTSFISWYLFLIFQISCDEYKWHCLETGDGLYPVDNNRDLLEISVGYYPVAHSRHLGVNSRVLRSATSHWPRVHTNHTHTTTMQWTTPITLKRKVHKVKYITNFPSDTSKGFEFGSRLRGLTAAKEKNTYKNQTSVSVNVWEYIERLKMFYNLVLIELNDKLEF